MSHIVSIQTKVKDPVAIRAACERLQLHPPHQGEAKLFSETKAGWIVQLPDWRYPIVCQTDSGEVAYDNYEGHWGDRSKLDQFLQSYAVEKAKLEARRKGHLVTEKLMTDGSIKLTVQVGGLA